MENRECYAEHLIRRKKNTARSNLMKYINACCLLLLFQLLFAFIAFIILQFAWIYMENVCLEEVNITRVRMRRFSHYIAGIQQHKHAHQKKVA